MAEDQKSGRDDEGAEDMEDVEIDGVVGLDEPSSSPKATSSNFQKELQDSKNELLYLRADFDNYRKRMIKERSDYLKYAGEPAFIALLEVLDNFERALQTEVTADNLESFKKGVELISENFKSTLKRFGVEEVPSSNVPFDPNFHEAIGSEESGEVAPGHISRVFRKTYKMHDRVIRPGQVIVAKPKQDKKDE